MAASLKRLKSEWNKGEYSYPSQIKLGKSSILRKLKKAASPQHVGKPKSEGMSDKVVCSCGWKSRGYWDFLEAALDEWLKHLADTIGLIPKKCVCGKMYTPYSGEKACHKLTPTKKKN